jgi:transcriptional regulator with GAF, ATPase, and Fis domain
LALSAASLSLVPAASARAFVELDERVVAAQPGVLIVRATADVHAPLMAHAVRRLRTSGWSTAYAAIRPDSGAPVFREIAAQLGVAPLPCDPAACAEAIAQAALARRAAIVAPLPKDGTWDRSVASELARAARILLVFVTAGDAPEWDASLFDVSGELGAAEKLRWLSAVAEEAQSDLPVSDLRRLEAWWSNACRVATHTVPAVESLGSGAGVVAATLALAGRSLPVSALTAVTCEPGAAVDELVAAGFAARNGALVGLTPTCAEASFEAHATSAVRVATARLLAGGPGFDPDPWAYARAAEILVGAGAFDEADAAIAKASRAAVDPQIAHEIATRWHAAVTCLKGDAGLALRLSAAARALHAGEANDALRWCESASVLRPDDPTIGLTMGRALLQLGDLVAARVSLQKSARSAEAAELRAEITAELAEVSYLAGDIGGATVLGEEAISLAETPVTRLAARNTLGKILLAQARWNDADAHFAEDVLTASSAGAGNAELRARLNRGIVLMSKGLLEEARSVMARVLEDGDTLGEDRARAFALSNLAVIAYRKHAYGEALGYWEQAVRFPVALRGRIATARSIANLAELRLRLGLTEHAEHAIAFGRRLLGPGTTAARASHFSVVAARIALARGNTETARREIESAIADGESAGDRDYLGEAYRVAARIALEDGDVVRAADALAQAEALATNDRARADAATVRALRLRALGQDAISAATQALSLARACGEEDLLAEIHALLATIHREAGDFQAAQAHCCRAIAVRDQVASGLPQDIRAAFLAKPEIMVLARLQASLASQDADGEEEAPRTQRMPLPLPPAGAREIVGDDPQIRSLVVAIRKVARANSTVLIRGESGTGKELVAEALHAASDRATGPLVSVNCAALVETLLLSELFGHEKGAFTGASSRRRGRFELAEGGTLFLDEIGDISPRTQVALLRVLQEKTFERVGGTQAIRANVRVICATHRDLKAMVERGDFREDLYYRLRGITLEVPALRQRLGDLPKIAEHLMVRIAAERNEAPKQLSQEALELLCRHRWQGNIRELENVLRAVSLFADGEIVTDADLIENVDDLRTLAQSGPLSQPPMSLRASLMPPPPSFSGAVIEGFDGEDDGGEPLPNGESGATAAAYATVRQGAVSLSDMKRQIERDCIARALEETKGNITRAASLLGMKRPRLSQLVKQYGLAAASSEGSQ